LQAAFHAGCWRYIFPLPSYLSGRQLMAGGACGKVGWRRVEPEGDGMVGERDVLKSAREAGCERLLPWVGGDP
jgi:hypothetical protein